MDNLQKNDIVIEEPKERIYRSRHSLWLKTVSSIIVVAFLAQDVVHAQGGAPLWSHVTKTQETSTRDNQSLLNKITIPFDAGLTRKVVANGAGNVIINIQDAHTKLGAQESITKILDNLVKNYDLKLIALEGASDLVDTSVISSFPIEEAKKRAGQYLLKEGKISAGEFYSMITKDPVSLYGVEDQKLYDQNLDVFKALVDKKLTIRVQLKGLKRAIHELEAKVYSPALLELTNHKLLHKNGDIKFTEYWDYFSRTAKSMGVDYEKYGNLKKLAATVDLEKEIDFKKASLERDALIEELGAKLPKPELERLVLQALQFKQNKITPGAFHYFLSQIAQGANINPMQYKNVILYSQYVVLYESIDLIAIFDEVDRFENDLREKMFSKEDERTLARLSHCAAILSQLLDTTLTSKDYEFFVANESACEIDSLKSTLQTLGEKYKVPFETYVDFNVLASAIPSAKKFYQLASQRNQVLLQNTLKRMKEEKTQIAALVTGGFHSEGISELMNEERLSYLVVMPKFEENSADRPYIAILTQKPKEYEEAFKDSDFYLQIPLPFSVANPNPEAIKDGLAAVLVSMGQVLSTRFIPPDMKNAVVATYTATYNRNGKKGVFTPEEFAGLLARAYLRRLDGEDSVTLDGVTYSYKLDNQKALVLTKKVSAAATAETITLSAEKYAEIQQGVQQLSEQLKAIQSNLTTEEISPELQERIITKAKDTYKAQVAKGRKDELKIIDIRNAAPKLGVTRMDSYREMELFRQTGARLAAEASVAAAVSPITGKYLQAQVKLSNELEKLYKGDNKEFEIVWNNVVLKTLKDKFKGTPLTEGQLESLKTMLRPVIGKGIDGVNAVLDKFVEQNEGLRGYWIPLKKAILTAEILFREGKTEASDATIQEILPLLKEEAQKETLDKLHKAQQDLVKADDDNFSSLSDGFVASPAMAGTKLEDAQKGALKESIAQAYLIYRRNFFNYYWNNVFSKELESLDSEQGLAVIGDLPAQITKKGSPITDVRKAMAVVQRNAEKVKFLKSIGVDPKYYKGLLKYSLATLQARAKYLRTDNKGKATQIPLTPYTLRLISERQALEAKAAQIIKDKQKNATKKAAALREQGSELFRHYRLTLKRRAAKAAKAAVAVKVETEEAKFEAAVEALRPKVLGLTGTDAEEVWVKFRKTILEENRLSIKEKRTLLDRLDQRMSTDISATFQFFAIYPATISRAVMEKEEAVAGQAAKEAAAEKERLAAEQAAAALLKSFKDRISAITLPKVKGLRDDIDSALINAQLPLGEVEALRKELTGKETELRQAIGVVAGQAVTGAEQRAAQEAAAAKQRQADLIKSFEAKILTAVLAADFTSLRTNIGVALTNAQLPQEAVDALQKQLAAREKVVKDEVQAIWDAPAKLPVGANEQDAYAAAVKKLDTQLDKYPHLRTTIMVAVENRKHQLDDNVNAAKRAADEAAQAAKEQAAREQAAKEQAALAARQEVERQAKLRAEEEARQKLAEQVAAEAIKQKMAATLARLTRLKAQGTPALAVPAQITSASAVTATPDLKQSLTASLDKAEQMLKDILGPAAGARLAEAPVTGEDPAVALGREFQGLIGEIRTAIGETGTEDQQAQALEKAIGFYSKFIAQSPAITARFSGLAEVLDNITNQLAAVREETIARRAAEEEAAKAAVEKAALEKAAKEQAAGPVVFEGQFALGTNFIIVTVRQNQINVTYQGIRESLSIDNPQEGSTIFIGRASGPSEESTPKYTEKLGEAMGRAKAPQYAVTSSKILTVPGGFRSVSQFHAALIFQNGEWYIVDLAAKNKTRYMQTEGVRPELVTIMPLRSAERIAEIAAAEAKAKAETEAKKTALARARKAGVPLAELSGQTSVAINKLAEEAEQKALEAAAAEATAKAERERKLAEEKQRQAEIRRRQAEEAAQKPALAPAITQALAEIDQAVAGTPVEAEWTGVKETVLGMFAAEKTSEADQVVMLGRLRDLINFERGENALRSYAGMSFDEVRKIALTTSISYTGALFWQIQSSEQRIATVAGLRDRVRDQQDRSYKNHMIRALIQISDTLTMSPNDIADEVITYIDGKNFDYDVRLKVLTSVLNAAKEAAKDLANHRGFSGDRQFLEGFINGLMPEEFAPAAPAVQPPAPAPVAPAVQPAAPTLGWFGKVRRIYEAGYAAAKKRLEAAQKSVNAIFEKRDLVRRTEAAIAAIPTEGQINFKHNRETRQQTFDAYVKEFSDISETAIAQGHGDYVRQRPAPGQESLIDRLETAQGLFLRSIQAANTADEPVLAQAVALGLELTEKERAGVIDREGLRARINQG